jgi:predicted acyltransferase
LAAPVAAVVDLEPVEAAPTVQRSAALDVFRGLTILLMLFVNNIMVEDVSPAIAHGEWSGSIGLADLVFPWFLLAVGVSLAYSWNKAKDKASLANFILKAGKRTVILVLLGMAVGSAVRREVTIGLGVLQIIGVAYFLASCFIRLSAVWRAVAAGLLLIGYGVFLHATPVPNFGPGDFTAEGNAARMVNDYLTPFGLRGLPSALPTAGAVLIGTILGSLWIRAKKRQTLLTFVLGTILTFTGMAWGLVTPHLKPIWTPSYICLTLGLGILLLGVLRLADSNIWSKVSWPLRAAGKSPIFAYVAPILFKIMVLQVWKMPGSQQSLEQAGVAAAGPWTYMVLLILAWWAIFLWMDFKKIVVKV